jgi:membrane protein YqaA with SNARE-associated domain
MLKNIYNWVLSWADTKYGIPVLAGVSFLESSVFPIPPDPLLMALSLGKPRNSFYYVIICSFMSIIGGIFGYLIGFIVWKQVSHFFFSYLFSIETFNYVGNKYTQNAFISVLGAAFTPIPYKVFTLAAGVFKINFLHFVFASAIGRSARFLIEGTLIYIYGDRIKSYLDKYFNILSLLFFVLLIIGFIIVKYLMK